MRYQDKDTNIIYTLEELKKEWALLPEDEYKSLYDGFEDWLECATDFSGHLQIIGE